MDSMQGSELTQKRSHEQWSDDKRKNITACITSI